MRILLIEDVVQIAELIRRGLGAEGWNVMHVRSEESALQVLEDQSFDALVLDLTLPDYHSKDAYQEVQRAYLRIRERVAATPILILSSFGSDEEMNESLHAASDRVLAKPFDFEEFVSCLEALNSDNDV